MVASVLFVLLSNTVLCIRIVFCLDFYSAGNSLNPLFDNGEFQSSHVQRAFQYLKRWESLGDGLDHFWFTPSQVMGDHAECIEKLMR